MLSLKQKAKPNRPERPDRRHRCVRKPFRSEKRLRFVVRPQLQLSGADHHPNDEHGKPRNRHQFPDDPPGRQVGADHASGDADGDHAHPVQRNPVFRRPLQAAACFSLFSHGVQQPRSRIDACIGRR